MRKLLLFALLFTSCAQAQDVISQLWPPDTNPLHFRLPPKPERTKYILQLKAFQAKHPHSWKVAFLLSAFDIDFEKNEAIIVQAVQHCGNLKTASQDCDEYFEPQEWLFYHGHPEVLPAILRDAISNQNIAAQEGLAGCVSEIASHYAGIFREALNHLTVQERTSACYAAGSAGGGGMDTTDLLNLQRLWGNSNDLIDKRCLAAVEAGSKDEPYTESSK